MRLQRIALAGGALLLTAAAPAHTVSELGWMSGDWATAPNDSWTEEHWSAPRGGVMLGASLSGKGGKAQGFEFLRIAADADGTLAYWGSPQGKPAVPFRLVSLSANAAVFENPKHDFPTRIAYRRAGATMTATISGPDGKNAQSWTYRLKK